jgi:hypothetical protein
VSDAMKAFWDRLAKAGLASGNDRWVTEASRAKADIDELEKERETERKKEDEITQRIIASGDKEAIRARIEELNREMKREMIWDKRWFRIHKWQRAFPSRKERSS